MLWLDFNKKVSDVCRCADKILNQLEIHADAVIANGGTAAQNSTAANTNRNNLKQIATSLKNHQLTPDPVRSYPHKTFIFWFAYPSMMSQFSLYYTSYFTKGFLN